MDITFITFLDEADDELAAALEDVICTMKQHQQGQFMLNDGLKVILQSPSAQTSHSRLAQEPADSAVSYKILVHSIVTRGKETWELTDQDRLDLAQKHKDSGSNLFKEKRYRGASVRYSKAIKYLAPAGIGSSESKLSEEISKLGALCMLNLAACQLQLNLPNHVVTNCSRVLQIEPTNVKGLYRRAKALLDMKDFEEARADLKKATELDPSNQAIISLTRSLESQEKAHLAKYSSALKGMFK